MVPTVVDPLRPGRLGLRAEVRVGVRPDEPGFTLVEVLVVLIIIAILMAFVVSNFRGAKVNVNSASLRAAAQSYSEAVDAFALDHAGRVPIIGSADWPSSAALLPKGPIKPSADAGGTAETYVGRFVPESIQGPQADIVSVAPSPDGTPPATGRSGVVFYRPGPAVAGRITTYRVEVWAAGQSGKLGPNMTCYYGTFAPPASSPPVKACA